MCSWVHSKAEIMGHGRAKYMYTLKYIMEIGEGEGTTALSQCYDWSDASMEPSLKYKTWNYIDNIYLIG